jgi:hypothetical protein
MKPQNEEVQAPEKRLLSQTKKKNTTKLSRNLSILRKKNSVNRNPEITELKYADGTDRLGLQSMASSPKLQARQSK